MRNKFNTKTAEDIIKKIEIHVKVKIQDRRLRSHLKYEIQRQLDKYNHLLYNLAQLSDESANSVFNNYTHRSHKKPHTK